jgi:hypothetical protein
MRKIGLALSVILSILGMSLTSQTVANAADAIPAPSVGISVSVGSTLVANPGDSWDNNDHTFRWFKNGSVLLGATNSSYKVGANDYLSQIYVEVSGTFQAAPLVTKSSPVTVSAGSLTLKPVPTISGSYAVGSILSANAGTWDQGVSLSYQWYSNGSAIANATKATYTLLPTDLQNSITVKVTGSAMGYFSESNTSAPITVVAGSLSLKPTPVISGTPTVGSVLTATPGTWDAGVNLNYQWLRDGLAIANASSATYTVVDVDFQKSISLKVTGSAAGYTSKTLTSSEIKIGALSLTPTPTISGSAIVGSVLTVTPGTWDADVTLNYQWFSNGIAIENATSSTYVLSATDFQKSISVKVTGTATGYAAQTISSSSVSVAAAGLTSKPIPTVSGSNTVGSVLTAFPGTWDSGVSLSYQWYSNGVAIPKATSATYTLAVADFQKSVTVKVTGSASGYTSETATSAAITVTAASLSLKPTPTVSGSNSVGSVLTAVPGTWDSGVSLSYQWLSNGIASSKATNPTYTLTTADFQKSITVRVTGSAAGYSTETSTSEPVLVAAGSLTMTGAPSILGSSTVGSVLSANPGSWDSGVALSYQWFSDDVAIANATSATYTLATADFQKFISVKVTGSASGYVSVTSTSNSIKVLAGSLTLTPTPVVSGVNKAGSVLSVTPGTWDAGVTLSYQWFREGLEIQNATNSTYTVMDADFQKSITVKVKGSAFAFVDKSTESDAIVIGALTLKPVPSVAGSNSVGSVLTAISGTWDAGVSLSYQWYSSGKAIANATSASYTLIPADFDKLISVVVTGSAQGYESVSLKTYPVTVTAGSLSSSRPKIVGSANVGAVLTANTGVWTSGTTFTFQWFNDGSAIPNATSATYTFASSNVGHELAVTVTGNLAGYKTVSMSSVGILPSAIPYTPCSAKIDSSDWLSASNTQPSISGEGHVGVTLKATTGTWAPGTSFCIYWYSNGQAIKGAFSKSYKIQASDFGQNLQFVVIGTDRAGNSLLRYSQFLPVTASDFINPAPWAITGIAKVGYKLGATSTKSWAIGVTYTYQWLRNGMEIAGATAKTYYATQADLGNSLSVRVCGTKDFFNKLCVTTIETGPVIAGRVTK